MIFKGNMKTLMLIYAVKGKVECFKGIEGTKTCHHIPLVCVPLLNAAPAVCVPGAIGGTPGRSPPRRIGIPEPPAL